MKQLLVTAIFIFTASPLLIADESAALAEIKRAGGIARPSPSGSGWDVQFHLTARDLTDDQLSSVTGLQDTVALNLRDTQISSAGLAHLKGLKKLRRLHLERTSVDDAGISNLSELKELEYLNLYSTKVTDKALPHLTGLANLKQLYLWQTEVTDEGVEKLQKALPDLRIVRGVDLSKVALNQGPKEPEKRVDLKWIATGEQDPPNSKTGDFITVVFENKREKPVKLFWVQYGGGLRHYADIAAGGSRLQTTYSNATWVITDELEQPLGHFRTGTDLGRAIIPNDA